MVILSGCDFFDLFGFLHIQPVVFKAPSKAVILSGCDFFDLFGFLHIQPVVFKPPEQSRHPERL
jgi:hypothetical protein